MRYERPYRPYVEETLLLDRLNAGEITESQYKNAMHAKARRRRLNMAKQGVD